MRAKRLQDLQEGWRARLARHRSLGLLFRLADSLFETPILTIPQAQSLLGVAYNTAKVNIDKLGAAGILRQKGESPYEKTFYAPDIWEIIA